MFGIKRFFATQAGKANVFHTSEALKSAEAALEAMKAAAKESGTKIDPKVLKAAKDSVTQAKKAFQGAAHGLNGARGSFTTSFVDAFGNAGTHIKHSLGIGKTADIAAHTLGQRVGLTERIFSKPFRMMGSRPGLTTGIVALLGIGAIGTAMHSSAARKTQANAMAAAEAASQPVQANAYGLQPGEFDRLVAPQLRSSEQGASSGFADRLAAAKAAQPTADLNAIQA